MKSWGTFIIRLEWIWLVIPLMGSLECRSCSDDSCVVKKPISLFVCDCGCWISLGIFLFHDEYIVIHSDNKWLIKIVACYHSNLVLFRHDLKSIFRSHSNTILSFWSTSTIDLSNHHHRYFFPIPTATVHSIHKTSARLVSIVLTLILTHTYLPYSHSISPTYSLWHSYVCLGSGEMMFTFENLLSEEKLFSLKFMRIVYFLKRNLWWMTLSLLFADWLWQECFWFKSFCWQLWWNVTPVKGDTWSTKYSRKIFPHIIFHSKISKDSISLLTIPKAHPSCSPISILFYWSSAHSSNSCNSISNKPDPPLDWDLSCILYILMLIANKIEWLGWRSRLSDDVVVVGTSCICSCSLCDLGVWCGRAW